MYLDFPKTHEGIRDRRAFYNSEEGITLIAQWRREGHTYEKIAKDYIGISSDTLAKWATKNNKLAYALKLSNDYTNSKVEESLFKRATGYDVIDETEELVEGEMRVTRRTKRHIPIDTKAALNWLFSRRPDRWRAIQEPTDEMKSEIENTRKVLIAIKEVATTGKSKEVNHDKEQSDNSSI